MPYKWIQRLNGGGILFGAVVWSVIAISTSPQPSFYDQLKLLIFLGIAVIAPLALPLTSQRNRNEGYAKTYAAIVFLQPIATISAGISLQQPIGLPSAVLASIWLLLTLLLALWGLVRLLPRASTSLDELCIDFGLLYSPVSGIWFVALQGQGGFLGFDRVLSLLTAIHFCYIPLGALIIAGMVGRQLRKQDGTVTRLYRAAAMAILTGPILIAVGITLTAYVGYTTAIEVTGVIILSSSVLVLSILMLFSIRSRIANNLSRVSITLSASSLFITIGLALLYSLGRLGNLWTITLPQMLQWHGWLNAVLFVLVGLCGWHLASPGAPLPAPGIPFSHLPWRWYIGPRFFGRIQAVDTQRPTPTGIVDDLADYQRADFKVDRIAPAIRAFYENTACHKLLVHPEWNPRLQVVKYLYKQLSQAVGQTNFPVLPDSDETLVNSQLLPLRDSLDGRERVRGWIRVYSQTGQAVYVAAYANHLYDGQRYMNIAFPLPGGNLTSVLRLTTLPCPDADGIHLTSFHETAAPGDQGVYFVTSLIPIRLPINETIDVFPSATSCQDFPLNPIHQGRIVARHRMWLCGIRFLTLYYTIIPG